MVKKIEKNANFIINNDNHYWQGIIFLVKYRWNK
jgi:hypothetical protein